MDNDEVNYDEAFEIAHAMRAAAFAKAEELGTRNTMLTIIEALDMFYDAIKRYTVLKVILGPEKFDEFADFLERIEMEKAIKEAEDALKDGEDG